jgi:hypothetical protein
METQVTLTIPEEVYRRAKQLAKVRNRPVADVLAESIVLDEDVETEEGATGLEDGMAALEAAAERSSVYDVSPFVTACEQVDWRERPAEAFVRGVRLALKVGAHIIARKLALEGAERFPEHAELKKMAHILGPPKVTVSNRPPEPVVGDNMAWLTAHWEEYKGQWVALRDGKVLATADSFEGVIELVGPVKNTGVLVTKLC